MITPTQAQQTIDQPGQRQAMSWPVLQTARYHLLIIHNDPAAWDSIRRKFIARGYRTSMTEAPDSVTDTIAGEHFDLILLDDRLVNRDHLDVIRGIRRFTSAPLIVITARQFPADTIVDMELGADAVLTRPVNFIELATVSKAALRMAERLKTSDRSPAPRKPSVSHYAFAGWRLDPRRHELLDNSDNAIPLTTGEMALLVEFCQSPGRVLQQSSLLSTPNGRRQLRCMNSIGVLVSRLRQKLRSVKPGTDLIKTIRGVGYMLDCEVQVHYADS